MLKDLKHLIDELGEENKIQAYIMNAGIQHLMTIIKFFDMTKNKFSPEISAILLSLDDSLRSNGDWTVIWELYIDLVDVCKEQGFDIVHLPVRALGRKIT